MLLCVLAFHQCCLLNHLVQFRLSLHTFLTTFDPRTCLLFRSGPHCVDLSRDLFSTCLPPSSRAGWCRRDFAFPCHSLFCHLSRFSVMARFKTALFFFTVDSLSRFGEEHEDETDTRCMVTEYKEATAPNGRNHSSEYFVDVIINTR